jgi:DNA invertase Pin-like site-specific DNA recombinase
MIIGYARVSTNDQNLDAQIDALTAVGAGRVFADKVSGAQRVRPELDRMLDQLRGGDVVKDLLEIVEAIGARGAGFCSLAEDIDTTTPAGACRGQAACVDSRAKGRGAAHARR